MDDLVSDFANLALTDDDTIDLAKTRTPEESIWMLTKSISLCYLRDNKLFFELLTAARVVYESEPIGPDVSYEDIEVSSFYTYGDLDYKCPRDFYSIFGENYGWSLEDYGIVYFKTKKNPLLVYW